MVTPESAMPPALKQTAVAFARGVAGIAAAAADSAEHALRTTTLDRALSPDFIAAQDPDPHFLACTMPVALQVLRRENAELRTVIKVLAEKVEALENAQKLRDEGLFMLHNSTNGYSLYPVPEFPEGLSEPVFER